MFGAGTHCDSHAYTHSYGKDGHVRNTSSNGILSLTGTRLPGTRSARKSGLCSSTHCSVLHGRTLGERQRICLLLTPLLNASSLFEKERLKMLSSTSYKKTRTAEGTICIILEGLLDRPRQSELVLVSMSMRYCRCCRLCSGRELLTLHSKIAPVRDCTHNVTQIER